MQPELDTEWEASKRKLRDIELHAQTMLNGLSDNAEPITAAPEWLGAPVGIASMMEQAGKVFSYGPGDNPSNEYLDMLLAHLDNIGVQIKAIPGEAPAFVGNVKELGAEALRSCRAVKPHIIRRYMETRAETSFRLRDGGPVKPDPDKPIEWDRLDSWGRCAAEDMPTDWMKWRYLYGPERHTWHAATGWEWEEGYHAEPVFRKAYKSARRRREEYEKIREIKARESEQAKRRAEPTSQPERSGGASAGMGANPSGVSDGAGASSSAGDDATHPYFDS